MNDVDGDKLAAEVIDRLLDTLPVWMSAELRGCDWSGDPWGELMALWFALNDACITQAIPCDETFRPSPFGPDDDSYWYEFFNEGLVRRIQMGSAPTDIEVAGWHKLFNTAYHALKLLGKDY